jgi:hypothetical protein
MRWCGSRRGDQSRTPVVQFTPNHDHNYYILSKSINETAWTFLKPRSLDQPQKFTVYPSGRN